MGALPAEAEAALAALDLLLRWAVLRLCDPHGNTTCLLRVLELCQALFGLLVSSGAQLSQYEALCCLPCLVEKAGHNQARPLPAWAPRRHTRLACPDAQPRAACRTASARCTASCCARRA